MIHQNKLCVAAIQSYSGDSDPVANRLRIETLVTEAKNKGAQLVLLPEFVFTGYRLESSIWYKGEVAQGDTFSWLLAQARQHQIWIGASFLEVDGDDFYNTFVLVNDDGNEVIRVRKSKPAATEAFFFRGDQTRRVLETPFGKIGVAICYEGVLAEPLQELYEEGAQLVLIPMSAPTPSQNKPLTAEDIKQYNDAVRHYAENVSKSLGVPAVMANKVGPWHTRSPWPFPLENSSFPGCSCISDGTGKVLANLEAQEGVIVAEVTLDLSTRPEKPPDFYGKWAIKPPDMFKLFVISETLGKLSYFLSRKRRRIARQICSQQKSSESQ
ncbi:MAG: carbon-nitrogen hydrolase family protein [Gammaproteobacteria bacterium]|nr:carbon-nitrogen hydrolase family protein [Gammaproteobacteria bacterium]